MSSAPTFGEHNIEVLKALGIPEETIDIMYEAGEFDGMDAKEADRVTDTTTLLGLLS